MNVSLTSQQKLTSIIRKYLPHAKIYLFGSRAKGTHNPGSDIDIAVDDKTPIAWSTLGLIKEDIENSNIILFVDIVDINSVSDELKKQIMKDGIPWN